MGFYCVQCFFSKYTWSKPDIGNKKKHLWRNENQRWNIACGWKAWQKKLEEEKWETKKKIIQIEMRFTKSREKKIEKEQQQCKEREKKRAKTLNMCMICRETIESKWLHKQYDSVSRKIRIDSVLLWTMNSKATQNTIQFPKWIHILSLSGEMTFNRSAFHLTHTHTNTLFFFSFLVQLFHIHSQFTSLSMYFHLNPFFKFIPQYEKGSLACFFINMV